MREFIVVLAVCFSMITFAQKKIPVDLVFEYNDELTYFENIFIGPYNLDYGTTLDAMEEGYRPYSGFQYIHWFNHYAPVHLEKDDSFTVVLGQEFDQYNFYYTGEKGAIKNNFVLDRYRVLLDLEKDSTFIKADKKTAINLIKIKKDSLISIANSLRLTEDFLKDEKKYWDYYEAYHNVFHKVLRSDNMDWNTLNLNDFPKFDYDIEEDHFNYRTYLQLSLAYYYHKLLTIPDYEGMRDEIKNIDSGVLRFILIELLQHSVLKRHERSDDFFKLIKRFSSQPRSYSETKIIYNKRDRLSIGDDFPKLKVTDFYDKEINLEKAKGKAAYLLLYSVNDKNLAINFSKWNKFYLDRKDENTRFLTIGLGTDEMKDVFKNFFLESQVVGAHLSTSPKNAGILLEDLSIGYGPVVIQLDENWKILNFNVEASFEKFNMYSNYPSFITWSPKLGDRP